MPALPHTAPQAPPQPSAPVRTVLVVDDRPTNREFLLTLLGFTPHRLLQASDGMQALALTRREHPDLIITDLLMPTMDGYAFTQEVRADPALRDIPVIFFSATYSCQEMYAMAAACGVRTVLTKPADPQAILDAVSRELGLDHDGAARADFHHGAPGSPLAAVAPAPSTSSLASSTGSPADPSSAPPADLPANASADPSSDPSADPSADPSSDPSADPSADPSLDPSSEPPSAPSAAPPAA